MAICNIPENTKRNKQGEIQNVPQKFLDEMGVIDKCIVCGVDVLLGLLTSHFISAHSDEQVCLCPICNEPIDINETSHVASHFGL